MSNCCGDFLRGSLRIILFLLSLLLVIGLSLFISGLFVFARSNADLNLALPGLIHYSHLYHPVALLAIGLIGCFGSCLANNTSIRVFAVLCIVNTLVLIIHVRYNIQPEDFKEYNKVFKDRMEAYEAQYDWFRASTGNQTANRAWTALQSSFLCCGLKKADDWNKWRPNNLSPNVYPASCCSDYILTGSASMDKDFCRGVFSERGCMDLVEKHENLLPSAYNFAIIYSIILCVLACILSCRSSTNDSYNGRVLSFNNANGLPQQLSYQRDGHLIRPVVQQPPENAFYKQQQQWIYPNAYAVEHNSPYVPPPSYGSTHG